MQKRGIMRKNLVEIILVVLLLGLILFVVARYVANEKAATTKGYFRELIDHIVREDDKDGKPLFIHIEDGWIIRGYDKGDTTWENCAGEACLCLCKKGNIWNLWKDDCEKEGFCKIIGKNVRLIKENQLERVLFQPGSYDIYLNFDTDIIKISGTLFEEPEEEEESRIEEDIRTEEVERTKEEVLRVMEYAKENSIEDRTCDCGDECEDYARWLVSYSEQFGIPDALLSLSLMMQESSCDKNAESGSSYGLMQINLGAHGLPSTWPWDDPETNIEKGLSILKGKYSTYKDGKQFIGACTEEYKQKWYEGWEAAVRGYNGWRCNPSYPQQDSFVDEVFSRYEVLKRIAQGQPTQNA